MKIDKAGRRPAEQEAVRTTIVGARPPGSGKSIGDIPRGIEVLVKKASVDAEFKKLVVEKRSEAAKEIELELDAAEVFMLNNVPRGQLEAIIAHTKVSWKSRAVFLGKVAAVMLAALGTGTMGCNGCGGIRPDEVNASKSQVEAPADKDTDSGPDA